MSLNLAILLSTIASVLLGLALFALRMRAWAAILLAGAAPGLGIIGYYFYLESQAPDGPYYAIVGLVYGIPAFLFGLGGAAVAVLVARGMGNPREPQE